jgi:hypothetical protein
MFLSEISLNCHLTIWRHIPKDSVLAIKCFDKNTVLASHLRNASCMSFRSYEVRQFNSRNGPVKAKFAYLCTSGCYRLRNTLIMKLCTSWEDGATAGINQENRFPEYLAVSFSRSVGCQEGGQIFVPSGHFLILEIAKNRRGLSQVNKVDGPICNGVLNQELANS